MNMLILKRYSQNNQNNFFKKPQTLASKINYEFN